MTVAFNSQVPQPAVWFKVIVTNTGGQTASAVQFVDSRGALPYGQSNANAVCDAKPTTMAAGAIFQCRYKVTFSTAGVVANTVTATGSNVTPDGNDSATATVTVTTCTGSNRVVPSLIGLNKAGASAAWTAAGFSGSLTTWNGQSECHRGRAVAAGVRMCPPGHDHDGIEGRDAMSRSARVARASRGQALVEFALILPIFLILLFGIIDFGRYVYTANSLNNAAREGARIGSVGIRPSPDCDGLSREACTVKIAKSRAYGLGGPGVGVVVSCARVAAGATPPTTPVAVSSCGPTTSSRSIPSRHSPSRRP